MICGRTIEKNYKDSTIVSLNSVRDTGKIYWQLKATSMSIFPNQDETLWLQIHIPLILCYCLMLPHISSVETHSTFIEFDYEQLKTKHCLEETSIFSLYRPSYWQSPVIQYLLWLLWLYLRYQFQEAAFEHEGFSYNQRSKHWLWTIHCPFPKGDLIRRQPLYVLHTSSLPSQGGAVGKSSCHVIVSSNHVAMLL